MLQRVFLLIALVGPCAGEAAAQASALDLIPANAAAAVVIRNPEGLRKKGDEFLKVANIDVGLRPTDALAMIKDYLGVNQGLDLEQPSAAVLLRSNNGRQKFEYEDLSRRIYIVLAYSDLDQMAGNFGFEKGELKLDAITKVKPKKQQAQLIQYVLARGKHFYVAMTDVPLQRLRQTKPVTGELSVAQRRTFGTADVLVHINPQEMPEDWIGLLQTMEAELGKAEDPQDKEHLGQFVKALTSVRFALAGIRVGEGLGINFLTAFPKEKNDAVQGFLDGLRTKGSADLKGLPEGRVAAAQAYAGDSARNAVFARTFVNFLLKNVLETKQITSATDRPAFVGVFNEVWQRLEGSRIAAYLTRDESKLGLFSLVAILDTEDAEKFLAEMRTLAKIADGTLDLTKQTSTPEIDMAQLVKDLSSAKYQVRASATTRLRLVGEPALAHLEKAVANPPDLETSRRAQLLIREISAVAAERRKELLSKDVPRYVRPTLAYISKAETRAGLPVDIVHIKLVDRDQPAARPMQQLFGPDWDKLRLAVHGKQVVVLLGSDVDLFEAALVNLKEGNSGLAGSKVTAGFAKLQTLNATVAFHLSLESLVGLVNGQPRRGDPARLSSFALSVQDAGLQLDLYIPTGDIKMIAKQRLP